MNKHITDEKTGISYTLQGDYYLPDLATSRRRNANRQLGTAALAVYPTA